MVEHVSVHVKMSAMKRMVSGQIDRRQEIE